MSERMSEDMSEDMSERMFKDMSKTMSEDMSERMSGNMSEDVCYGSQGKCLWVMLHKIDNFAIGNEAKLMLCHVMWRVQQILLAQLFVCKQVSLAWQPWRSSWWNVLRRSSLGWPVGLTKELG